MTNPQKRKGSKWERDLVNWFNQHGHPGVERAYGAGRPDDRGDLTGIPGFTIEAKNHQKITLATFVDETAREAHNAGTPWYATIIKRRSRPPADAYVVMPLHIFADLIGGNE